jgi:hypothetical protein
MQGSFIPFARTRAERERANDPRRSVEERLWAVSSIRRDCEAANDLVAGVTC